METPQVCGRGDDQLTGGGADWLFFGRNGPQGILTHYQIGQGQLVVSGFGLASGGDVLTLASDDGTDQLGP